MVLLCPQAKHLPCWDKRVSLWPGQRQSSHAVTCSVLTLPLSCGSCLRYSPLKNWGQARVWQVFGVCSNSLKKQASTKDFVWTKKKYKKQVIGALRCNQVENSCLPFPLTTSSTFFFFSSLLQLMAGWQLKSINSDDSLSKRDLETQSSF